MGILSVAGVWATPIKGIVVDGNRAPLSGCEVSLMNKDAVVITTGGTFQFVEETLNSGEVTSRLEGERLHFEHSEKGNVSIRFFNLAGEQAGPVINLPLPPGPYSFNPSAYLKSSAGEGIYFVTIAMRGRLFSHKFVHKGGGLETTGGITVDARKMSLAKKSSTPDTLRINCSGWESETVPVPAGKSDLGMIAMTPVTQQPDSDVEIVFAVRDMGKDYWHWYGNLGYDANNPIYTNWGTQGKLVKMNLRTRETTILVDDVQGSIRDPHLHYDGSKIIFSWLKGGTSHFNLYEINTDGSGLRQLTSDPHNDIEPVYLPDGGIAFSSTRVNRYIPCWKQMVGVIHRMDGNGNNIRKISANVEWENTPWVMEDGRLMYMRWEYIQRSQIQFHHLWVMNPDGTEAKTLYGNMTPGGLFADAKPVPGSDRIVFSRGTGHGHREHIGQVAILDPNLGPDDPDAVRILNPGEFRDPYPVTTDSFLVVSDNNLLLMNNQGVTENLYTLPAEWGAQAWIHEPRVIRARKREPVLPSRIDPGKATGTVNVMDVYLGRNMDGIPRGAIKNLLVTEVLPVPVHLHGHQWPLTQTGGWNLERILGKVPVESDGSAYMELPANRALRFVALDENDNSIKGMASFFNLMPGENASCTGCHESKTDAVPILPTRLALGRPPSIPVRDEGIPEIIGFAEEVQPILTQNCTQCHNGDRRDGRIDLTGDNGPIFSMAYFNLTMRMQVADSRNGIGNRAPYTFGSGASPLVEKLESSHHNVQVSEEQKKIVKRWIDAGATYPGTYASIGKGYIDWESGSTIGHLEEVKAAQNVINNRCAACHTGATKLPVSAEDRNGLAEEYLNFNGGMTINNPPFLWPWDPEFKSEQEPIGSWAWTQKHVDHRGIYSRHTMYNLTQPDKSLLLKAPLAASAGGLGYCSPAVFSSTSDGDYQTLLAGIQKTAGVLEGTGRFSMPGFKPGPQYIREMKKYGILPESFDVNTDSVDVYAIDKKYFESFWYEPDVSSLGIKH